jgi:hypothetical protein
MNILLTEIDDQLTRMVLDYAKKYPEPTPYELDREGTFTYTDLMRQSDFHFLFGAYSVLHAVTGNADIQKTHSGLFQDIAAARQFLQLESESKSD